MSDKSDNKLVNTFESKLAQTKEFAKTTKGKLTLAGAGIFLVLGIIGKVASFNHHAGNFAKHSQDLTSSSTVSTPSKSDLNKLVQMLNREGKIQDKSPMARKEGVTFGGAGISGDNTAVFIKYKLTGKQFNGLTAEDMRNNGFTEKTVTTKMCANPSTKKMLKYLDYLEFIYVTASDDTVVDAKVSASDCK